MRKKIYDIIEPSEGENLLSSIYDGAMMFLIVLSLVPLAFKGDNIVFRFINIICVSVFIAD
ncbi:MAG: hypothetical protein LIO44_07675 [Eubacterium sp.]|nr:hypothetical protein [Eubacterium sp.]